MIQHVIQRLSGNGDAESVRAGEVRQAELAGRVRLSEDHLPIGTMTCPPVTDAALEGAPDARVQFGVTPHQFREHAERANARIALQHRHDLFFEHPGQRVRTPPPPWGLLL